MEMHMYRDLLSAVRLLVSEDRCEGRFVFGRQVLKSLKSSPVPLQPALIPWTESGPGGDNPKSQLQTLLTRAGYAAPSYKSRQLKNNQFLATVEFNGIQIMGRPCNNKKSAEKDAAAEALQWLMGGTQTSLECINQMSLLLKKSKKDHFWISTTLKFIANSTSNWPKNNGMLITTRLHLLFALSKEEN